MNAVVDKLKTLRIAHLAEWDVLAFIYNHGTSLTAAERIAQLLGYSAAVVGAALDSLTSGGLVERSRNSRGVRLYRFAEGAADDPRRGSLEELMKLTEGRQGRLLLIRNLPQAAPVKELRDRGGLRLARKTMTL